MTDSTNQASLFGVTGKTVTVWADASCQRVRYPDTTAGYGCVIKTEDSDEIKEIQGQVQYDDRPTPPVAEYRAIINGIEWVRTEYSSVGVLQIYSDAETPVEQIDSSSDVGYPHLLKLQREAHRLLYEFDEWHIDWQDKTQSREIRRANKLGKKAMREAARGDRR
jgi:ribonuclease HI